MQPKLPTLMTWNESTHKYEGFTKNGNLITVSFEQYCDALSRIAVGGIMRGLDGKQASMLSRVCMLPEFWEKKAA